jgi:ferredoxin
MKASVDPDRCQGHARCWEICPEVFDLDDEGHASVIVDVVPLELEDKARQAVINCPERAISVD